MVFPNPIYLDFNPPGSHSFDGGSPELASNCSSVCSSRENSPIIEPAEPARSCNNNCKGSISCNSINCTTNNSDLQTTKTHPTFHSKLNSTSHSKQRKRQPSRPPLSPADLFNEITLDVFGEEQTILSRSLQSNNAIQAEFIGTTSRRIRPDPNRRQEEEELSDQFSQGFDRFVMSSSQSSRVNDQNGSGSRTESTCGQEGIGLFPPIAKGQFDKGNAIPLLPDFSEDPRVTKGSSGS